MRTQTWGQKRMNEQLCMLRSLFTELQRQQRLSCLQLQSKISKKADRTQLQKAIHLSNLIAIQCKQLRQRFREVESREDVAALERRLEGVEGQLGLGQEKYSHRSEETEHVQRINVLEQRVLECIGMFDSPVKKRENQIQGGVGSMEIQAVNQKIREVEERITWEMENMRKENQVGMGKIRKIMENQWKKQNSVFQRQIRGKNQQLVQRINSILGETIAKQTFLEFCTLQNNKYKQLIGQFNYYKRQISANSQNNQKLQQCKQQLREQIHHNSQIIKVLRNELNVREQQLKRQWKYTIETKQSIKRMQNRLISMIQFTQAQQNKNQTGRWFWKSGELHNNLVKWDNESSSRLHQNYKYSQSQCCIIIVAGGIYCIEAGFYAKKKPSIQLILNGKTIVSAVNSNSYVIHHSSGKLKDIGSSQVTGLTCIQYLLLPASSRLSVTYMGEQAKQGFLSLRRM